MPHQKIHLLFTIYVMTLLSGLFLYSCEHSPKNQTKFSNKNIVEIPLKKISESKRFFVQSKRINLKPEALKYPLPSDKFSGNSFRYRNNHPALVSFTESQSVSPDTILTRNVASEWISAIPETHPVNYAASKQLNSESFIYFDKLQGLKQSFITCLTEDDSGNIWLGTHGGGLTRYDGKNFTHFSEKEGLPGNSVFCVRQTSDGNFWIGTYGKGISIFDGKKFTNISTENGFPSNNIYTILEDNKKQIWIGTENAGLVKFKNSDLDTMYQYSSDNGFFSNKITALVEDEDGNIWAGSDGNGLTLIDTESKIRTFSGSDLSHMTVTDLKIDPHGSLWMATYGDGLFNFRKDSLFHYSEKDGFISDFITSMELDDDKNIWIGTDGKGAVKMNQLESPSGLVHYFDSSHGLSSDKIYALLKDKSGSLWLGTNRGGVNKYNGHKFSHIQNKIKYPTRHVLCITEDLDKNIWIGTDGDGLIKFNHVAGSTNWNEINHISTSQGLSSDNVYCSMTDSKNRIWLGTADGVNVVDKGNVTVFNKNNEFCGDKVLSIYEDSKGRFWFGLADGGGVAMYDGRSLTCYSGKDELLKTSVFSIAEDEEGKIWLGTEGQGLMIWDGQNLYKYDHHLINNSIFSLRKDSDGLMWIGSEGNGLFVFKNGNFYNVTENKGLSNNFVFSILEDHNGDMWFGTRFGLSLLEKEKKNLLLEELNSASSGHNKHSYFRNYSYDDGFLGIGCTRNAIFQSSDNKIWLGTTDRLTINHLAENKNFTQSPDVRLPLFISGVDIFNEKIQWLEFYKKETDHQSLNNGITLDHIQLDNLSSWYFIPENLRLKHNHNYLTFHFSAISQNQPSNIQYQYRMDGLREDWSAWSNSQTAHYGHLSPGKYTLQVKAMDSAGHLSNTISYAFTIENPWWSAWWMKIIYVLVLTFLIYYIHLSQKNRTIKNERLLSQAREIEQAKEIEKAYEDLKSTQAQLIQAEKMASLGELTAGIAHEIQNPLNFVNNFSEVSTELLEEMEHEMDLGDIEEAKALASDIRSNLEKINTHGKRADAIVKGMLQHSRSNSGQKDVTDINALCDEFLRLSFHGIRAKDKDFNAVFETHLDPSLPKIKVVPQDIGRVILNLINNAFYAVNEKNKKSNLLSLDERSTEIKIENVEYVPKVTVSTKNLGQTIEITVHDNGFGIPDAIKDKIFQPFFTTKPTGQGTGLGLSLAYDIVKVHGGEIKIQSKENEESDITIVLPV